MNNPHPTQASLPSQQPHDPSHRTAQSIDMTFSASGSACKSSSTPRKPWLRSLDSQEFDFISSIAASTEVAPADELFFKGQLLPLQLDHRHHLLKALSSTGSMSYEQVQNRPGSARLPSKPLATDLGADEELIEFNSCRLQKEVSFDYLKQSFPSSNLCLHTSKFEELCDINRHSDNLCTLKDCTYVDGATCTDSGTCMDSNCRCQTHDVREVNPKAPHAIDSMTDPGSWSFRSQNSSYWDSGADRDVMDSSSSRDSNGSSQDSCFNSIETPMEAPPFISGSSHPHRKLNLDIPWRIALFRRGRGVFRKEASHISSLSSFSEDLGKCKASTVPPMKDVKAALLPWKLERDGSEQAPRRIGHPQGGGNDQRRSYHIGGSTIRVTALCRNSTEVCNGNAKKSTLCNGVMRSGMPAIKAKADAAEMQGSASGRWQVYVRRLKPLYEMKRGLMGQLRMDECGKRASCEVEQGSVQVLRAASRDVTMQRVSHQSSSRNVRKPSNSASQHPWRPRANRNVHDGDRRELAMPSCPSSAICSPNHSGVLAVTDYNQRICSSKPANPTQLPTFKSSAVDAAHKSPANAINAGIHHTSVSTMHELHNAVQSAIAHCKESNKKPT